MRIPEDRLVFKSLGHAVSYTLRDVFGFVASGVLVCVRTYVCF